MKKILAIAMALLMTAGLLAACGGDAASTPSAGGSSTPAATGDAITLRVWGPQEEQDLLNEMGGAFAAAHPEYNITFEYGVVAEGDARTRYNEDPAAAADVFMFANDHLRDFVAASALYEVTRNKDDVTARNTADSVDAATFDGSLWAYPMTADNGYFLYYDKSVFTEEDVQTLDGMLAAANAAGKKVFMDLSNGWYIVSFFFGAGCTMNLNDDGTITCDFNGANGLAAAEAIKAFAADPAFMTGADGDLTGGMGTTIAAGVGGTWNAEAIMAALGGNYAATKLPTFTSAGQQKQMSSYAGFKLVGVNSLTQYPVEAMDLADWLTNAENQARRYEVRGLGPSNTAAAGSDAVKANVALSALNLQNELAVPQKSVPGDFWVPAEAFGAALEAKDYSKDLQTMLDELVAQVNG